MVDYIDHTEIWVGGQNVGQAVYRGDVVEYRVIYHIDSNGGYYRISIQREPGGDFLYSSWKTRQLGDWYASFTWQERVAPGYYKMRVQLWHGGPSRPGPIVDEKLYSYTVVGGAYLYDTAIKTYGSALWFPLGYPDFDPLALPFSLEGMNSIIFGKLYWYDLGDEHPYPNQKIKIKATPHFIGSPMETIVTTGSRLGEFNAQLNLPGGLYTIFMEFEGMGDIAPTSAGFSLNVLPWWTPYGVIGGTVVLIGGATYMIVNRPVVLKR